MLNNIMEAHPNPQPINFRKTIFFDLRLGAVMILVGFIFGVVADLIQGAKLDIFTLLFWMGLLGGFCMLFASPVLLLILIFIIYQAITLHTTVDEDDRRHRLIKMSRGLKVFFSIIAFCLFLGLLIGGSSNLKLI